MSAATELKNYNPKGKLLLIAGPCSLEGEATVAPVAEKLQALQAQYGSEVQFVFKGSFDKANRTSVTSPRGPGLEAGLKLLAGVKQTTGLPVLTDFHTPEQAAPVAEVCDVLQVPAFLCRQTDLLVAAAQTGKVVNVKKGQFVAPQDMAHVVHKMQEAGTAKENLWLTERGSSFGYQNLVVDFRSIPIMAQHGYPVILDATHCLQLPSAAGGQSGGTRQYVPHVAKAALAVGAHGLFVETHPNPEAAISDAATQWPLENLEELIEQCLKIWHAVR